MPVVSKVHNQELHIWPRINHVEKRLCRSQLCAQADRSFLLLCIVLYQRMKAWMLLITHKQYVYVLSFIVINTLMPPLLSLPTTPCAFFFLHFLMHRSHWLEAIGFRLKTFSVHPWISPQLKPFILDVSVSDPKQLATSRYDLLFQILVTRWWGRLELPG